MRIYEMAHVKGMDPVTITLGNRETEVVTGKHCLWLPEEGMKIIWSHNGRIESFRDWDKGRHKEVLLDGTFNLRGGWHEESLKSIYTEYAFMKRLSEDNMAPPVGEMFFIKLMTSDYPTGVEYCDVRGRFGYFIADAATLALGEFTRQRFDIFCAYKGIEMSKEAYNDIFKPDNIVNGYLIDIRRTLWDMLKYPDHAYTKHSMKMPDQFSKDILRAEIAALGQFPYNKRKQNYQDYFMDGTFYEGSRDTLSRFKIMQIEELNNMTALDIGCNIGSVLFECFNRNGAKMLGIDGEQDYIDLARKLAAYNDYPINFTQMDLMEWKRVVKIVRKYFCDKTIDVVFALSIYKHIGDIMFDILREIPWKRCYIESHNAPKGLETDHVHRMVDGMDRLGVGMITYLGQTGDRSPRCVWRLEA